MSPRALVPILASLCILQAADDPWRYVEPTSKMVMGVQWRRIHDSALGARLRQDVQNSLPMLPAMPGMDFLNNIDNILIASPGLPAGKKDAQPPVLIIVSGQFDLAKVRASVNKKSRRAVVQNIEIYESDDKSGGRLGIALVSPETLLLGDVPSLVRAAGATTARESLTTTRARQMNVENQFWVVSSISPAEVTGQNIPMPVPLPMQDVRGLEMGIAVADGFGLEVALKMTSPDVARKLKADLAKTVQLAAKEKKNPEMANIDKYLKVSADREYLRMSVYLNAAELDQRLRAFQARRKVETAAAQSKPAITKPAIAKPVIWNADQD